MVLAIVAMRCSRRRSDAAASFGVRAASLACSFLSASEQQPETVCCGASPAPARRSASEAVQRTIEDIVALLAGERRDLAHAVLDCGRLPDFNRRVYDVARDHSGGRDVVLRRSRRAARRPTAWPAMSRRRSGKIRSRSSCRAIASGGGRQDWRIFGAGRRAHQAAPALDRGRAARRSDAVCRSPARARPRRRA